MKQALNRIRNRTNGSLVELGELLNELPEMSPLMVEAVLKRMEAENMVMFRDGYIILI